jgi:hypothetical protein
MIKYSNTFIKHAPTKKIKNFVFFTKIDTKQVGNEVKNFKKRQNVRKTPNHNCKPTSVVDVFFLHQKIIWAYCGVLTWRFWPNEQQPLFQSIFHFDIFKFFQFWHIFEKNEKF